MKAVNMLRSVVALGHTVMLDRLNETHVDVVIPLQDDEINAVAGGVSIYVDGVYRGEGTFDYWPWPGGRSSTGAPVVWR